MNNKTICIAVCVAPLVSGAGAKALAADTLPAKPYGADREELHAGLDSGELPPASELARKITREIVGAQRNDAQLRADFPALHSVLLPAESAGLPPPGITGAGQSAPDAARKKSAWPQAWVSAVLRQLAELLRSRQ